MFQRLGIPAVHWARGILFSFNGESFINDCEVYNMGNSFANRIKDSDLEKEREIEVFPNPTKEDFNVSLELGNNEDAKIIVYDVSGKELLNSELRNGLNSIETGQLESSMYYYHILVNGKIKKSDKLIIL